MALFFRFLAIFGLFSFWQKRTLKVAHVRYPTKHA